MANHAKATEVVFLGPGRYLEAFGQTIEVGDQALFSDEEIAALEAQGLQFGTADADAAEPEAETGEGQHTNDEKEE